MIFVDFRIWHKGDGGGGIITIITRTLTGWNVHIILFDYLQLVSKMDVKIKDIIGQMFKPLRFTSGMDQSSSVLLAAEKSSCH